MGEKVKLLYSSAIDRLTAVNSSFDKGVLYVAYAGENRNKTFISKENFERAMPTSYNCPIVCNYIREEDAIGSHDVEFVNKEGTLRMVNVTQPVGVIPTGANYWWEEVEEDDGTMHEYLCIEAIVWKRQEAYQKIKDEGITDESMEISVTKGHKEDGIFVIEDFEFTAFCLLGKAAPCFESASLQLFSMDEFGAKYSEMMEDFKASFSDIQQSISAGCNPNSEINPKGGISLDKHELLAKYELTCEDLDFDLDTADEDGLEARLAEIKAAKDAAFQLTGEQLRGSLMDALESHETVECEWGGKVSRYFYVDYDAEAGEVYGYDVRNDWQLMGFGYSMDGDNPVIDFDNGKRKKFAIVDFDEGTQAYSYARAAEMIERSCNEAAAARYNELEQRFNQMQSELSGLQEFKAQKDAEERKAAEDGVFERFDDELSTNAEYAALRDNCGELTIDEIEEKCFAIRGRNMTFSYKPTSAPTGKVKIDVQPAPMDDEPYGGLFVKYNRK